MANNIRTLDFISKIGDAYFVVFNTLEIINKPNVQQFIVDTMMQGSDQLLQELVDKQIIYHEDPQKTRELKKEIFEQLKKSNLQKVQDYVPVLLNQNLVMLCTIMEIFFLHILETAMVVEPNTLMGLAQEKNINLQQVITLKNYDSIIEDFRLKVLDHFSRQGLKEKFKIFEKIGFDVNQIFDYSKFTSDVQDKFKNYSLDTLDQIFEKRHNIVHKNALPLKHLSELIEIKDFFEKIILNISTIVMVKYGVLLDFQDKLVQSGFPRENIPVRQQKN